MSSLLPTRNGAIGILAVIAGGVLSLAVFDITVRDDEHPCPPAAKATAAMRVGGQPVVNGSVTVRIPCPSGMTGRCFTTLKVTR